MTDREPRSGRPVDEEELFLLVDAVQDYAIFLLSPEGIIRSWNRGAQRIMGYEAEEAVGRHFQLVYGPADVAARKPHRELEDAAAHGRIEDEGWRIRKDGKRFWANTIITALRDDSGNLRAFAKVTRDLTARREADERLRQSEELLRLLVGSVEDYAIFMLDPGGHIATWNLGAQRIKGYQPSEIIGKHFSVFYPPEDIANGKPEFELEVAERDGSAEDEGWRLRKDGTRFWANVVITAVRDATGTLRGFAKVTRDVTERKAAEETRRALLEQREARLRAEEERSRAETSYRVLQESNRAKDQFLMTLSHELRTPMTSIMGWARLLPSLDSRDEMFREAVDSIARNAEVQARLIDDVLDVSRIVSGKMRLSIEEVDPGAIVAAAIDSVRPGADARSITVRTEIGPSVGIIMVDPTRLQQIMWNLLANAVKFTPHGGSILVTVKRSEHGVQFTVTDSGEGIHSDFLPHVFEPFRQGEEAATRVHGGLGLGLSIVRYIAEAHGGTVSAESAGRGKGATFIVTLPAGVPAIADPVRTDAPGRPATTTERLAAGQLRGVSVLVVDDDSSGRGVIRAVLQHAGASVTAVESVAKALEQLAAHRFQVLISDIAMPGTNGYELAREVRSRPDLREMKVVALSAFPRARLPEDEGAFDLYLTKPIDPARLLDAIEKVQSGQASRS